MAIGANLLDPWTAREVVTVSAQDKGQELAAPRDRAETGDDLGMRLRGGVHTTERKRGEAAVGGPEPREVHGDAVLEGGSGKPCCPPLLVGLRGDVLADRGQ
jgi:hypothetical protein